MVRNIITPGKIILSGVVLIGLLFVAVLAVSVESSLWVPPNYELNQVEVPETQAQFALIPTSTQAQELPIVIPTPDSPRQLPALRAETEIYTVQPRDSLHTIAQQYFVSVETLLPRNQREPHQDSKSYLTQSWYSAQAISIFRSQNLSTNKGGIFQDTRKKLMNAS
jgi:LysM repeat protein